ncbi:MAG: replication protein P, partial [Plesiomonas sp.]
MGELKTFENMPTGRRALHSLAQVVDYSQVQINPAAVQNVNDIFRELAITFPAWRTAYPDAESLNSAKQVWAKGLIENGVTDMGLICIGLRVARSQAMPFIPSVGQFIAWCRSQPHALGLPTVDEVMAEFDRYSSRHHDYSSPELFPWSAPVMYWIVLDIRRAMYKYNHTAAEVRKNAEKKLKGWEKKLLAGETVPAPVVQVENKSRQAGVAQQADVDGRYLMLGNSVLAAIRSRK